MRPPSGGLFVCDEGRCQDIRLASSQVITCVARGLDRKNAIPCHASNRACVFAASLRLDGSDGGAAVGLQSLHWSARIRSSGSHTAVQPLYSTARASRPRRDAPVQPIHQEARVCARGSCAALQFVHKAAAACCAELESWMWTTWLERSRCKV
jgi:hypothetical protein